MGGNQRAQIKKIAEPVVGLRKSFIWATLCGCGFACGLLLLSTRKLPDISVIKEEASRLGVNGSWFICEPDYASLEQLSQLIQQGSLKIEISAVFPLDKAVEALERISQGHAVGKTVLKVD